MDDTETVPLRPSIALQDHMDQVRAIIARYPVQNARFFGSTSRGDDRDGSDLDILVEPTEVTTLFLQDIDGSTRPLPRQRPARAVADMQDPHDPGALVDRKDDSIDVRLFAEQQVPQRTILRRHRASRRMLVEAQNRRLKLVEPRERLR
jgi:hypothetical protein